MVLVAIRERTCAQFPGSCANPLAPRRCVPGAPSL